MKMQLKCGRPRAGQFTKLLAVTLILGFSGAASAAPARPAGAAFQHGGEGAGDDYFPHSGNGGYDVQHYDLKIAYTPPVATEPPTPIDDLRGHLEGVATIDLVATQGLDRFNLDLRGMEVHAVTVNGKPLMGVDPPAPGEEVDGAAWWQVQDDAARSWELTLQLRPKLKAGQAARVVVSYSGETTRPRDINGVLYGWVTTPDGAMVAAKPDGAMTWFPANDHPTDKATFSFEITVPEGKVAVANGLPSRDPESANGWTTWYWHAPDLQASYLATAVIGDFEKLPISYSSSGVPILDYLDTKLATGARTTSLASLAMQPGILDYFESIYGPYPFSSFGATVDNDSIGYSIETQTRPLYSTQGSTTVVVHLAAQMWFGNSVSLQRWRDIWLSEGWGTYSSWLWREHMGVTTVQALFDSWYAPARTPAYWALPIGDPGPLELFATQVYDRGAGTLHALRLKLGDEVFFNATREWLARNKHSNATTGDFIALFEELSGQDLGEFFDIWLFRPEKPVNW
jgi:aminopeptidase N